MPSCYNIRHLAHVVKDTDLFAYIVNTMTADDFMTQHLSLHCVIFVSPLESKSKSKKTLFQVGKI